MQKFIQWVLWSSDNPEKISRTITGVILGVGAVVAHFVVGLDLSEFANSFAIAIQAVLGALAAIFTAYGAFRKLWTTYKGTNKVI